MAGGNCSVRREEIAWSLANAGQIRYHNYGEGCLRKEGHKTVARRHLTQGDNAKERKRRIPSWLFKSRGPKEKPCPIKGQRRGHSKEKQAKWPREDDGRGRSSLWCDHRADWDLQVRPTRGGLQEICLHSERVLAEPQGVLPVRDGSYKSTHQPMHHSAR